VSDSLDYDSGTGRRIVCYCFDKTAEDIRSEILRLGIRTLDEALRVLCAGNGCTLCRPDLETILVEASRARRETP
jgi:NAD(P)H-nitrite reductase large subunit